MRAFSYQRATDARQAMRAAAAQPMGAPTSASVQFVAGGTTMLDLMKLGTMRPQVLVDISDLRDDYAYIRHDAHGLHLGALTRMHTVADDPGVNQLYPVIALTMQLAASAQLRNMATLGGNVLQRTRCNYFRDGDWSACNKRNPGSGCAALEGLTRKHAVLGVGERCISAYPGDFAQALVALGATVEILGPAGTRVIPFESLHLGPEHPERETVLLPGELIVSFHVPAGPWTRRSTYVKVRDRESYEFGLATAAVALHLEGSRVLAARIGLGGVAYRPWRAHEAEASLTGQELNESTAEAAARAAFATAVTHGENVFKPALGRHTLVRALLQAQTMEAV
ncbi:MAG TPA: xanthine dehydrogenase family protein subunit M [Steroidobacteraceae bacterium]